MAFSAAEKGKIRWYLGYPSRFYQVQTQLEQAMNAVDGDAESNIRTQLGYLDTLFGDLIAARPRLKAIKVGSIELPAGGEIGVLRSEGRRFVNQIAATFSVPVRVDVFSSAGPGQRLPW